MKKLNCDLYIGDCNCVEICDVDKHRLCCFYCGIKNTCLSACPDLDIVEEIEVVVRTFVNVRYTNGRESAESFSCTDFTVEDGDDEESVQINITRQIQSLDFRKKEIGFWEFHGKFLVDEVSEELKENLLQYFRSLYNTVVQLEKWGHSNESISGTLKKELDDLTKDNSVGSSGGEKVMKMKTGIKKFCDDCEKETVFDVVNEGHNVEQGRNLFSSTCGVCGKKEFEWRKL